MNFFVMRWSVLTARFGDELADPRAERQSVGPAEWARQLAA